MKLNLGQLRDLEAVARYASVTGAARALYRSPSTLSYSIRRLEEVLGITLLDRRSHSAKLTSQGEALAQEARSLLAHAERTERRMRLARKGWETSLTIAVSDLIPMGRVLSLIGQLYRETPDTRVHITREVLTGGWDALVASRADLAIGVPADGAPGSAVETRALAEVKFVFVMATDHPLAAETAPLSAEQIRQHRAVAASDTTRGLPARTLRILEDQPILSVPDQATKHAAILRGLGVGFLPERMVKEDIRKKRLIAPSLSFSAGESHTLCYAWRADETGRGLAWLAARLEAEAKTGDWLL
jgi:DNA-binding transcriptional LysR family regulator